MKQEVLQYWYDRVEERGFYKVLGAKKFKQYPSGISKLFLKVYDEYGYLSFHELRHFLYQDHFGIEFVPQLFNVEGASYYLENIQRFIELNNKPYIVCDDNYYISTGTDLKLYCPVCGNNFYISWTGIKQYVKTKSHSCNVKLHRLVNNTYDENSKKKKLTEFHMVLPEQESVYDERYGNVDAPLVAEFKKYCVNKYKGTPEYDECINPETHYFLPYDVFLPEQNIYIELQGHQHYVSSNKYHKTFGEFEKQKQRDIVKKQHAEHYGTFVEIDLTEIRTTEEAISYMESFI